jgi:hypothetical protein
VLRFINTVAFEARCIRPGGVVPHMPIKGHGIGCQGYPKGAHIVREWGGSLTVLAQYASVATPCRMRRIDPLGATPYL